MTLLAKISDNQVIRFPYTLVDLRREVPGVSFPDAVDDATLISYGVVRVAAANPPTYDSLTHRLTSTAELVDGGWLQVWAIQTLSESDATANVRTSRNKRLADCDWTQLPDAPSLDAQVWTAYRQALRDITSQPGFPHNVTWPEEPAVSTPER